MKAFARSTKLYPAPSLYSEAERQLSLISGKLMPHPQGRLFAEATIHMVGRKPGQYGNYGDGGGIWRCGTDGSSAARC